MINLLPVLNLSASDVSGQRRVNLRGVRSDTTVGELLDELLPRLNLQRTDANGQPMPVAARLDREGRHLHRSELVGEALRDMDELVLHPQIMAGSGR